MQHVHEINGKTFLLVEIGEHRTAWRIQELKSAWLLTWGNGNDYIKMPPSNWEIVGKASEATEWSNSFDTALESFNSLLRSHNMQPQTTLILQQI